MKLVLGGPGCGKTTYLLEQVVDAVDRGFDIRRIGFVAFTKRAAAEAKQRIRARLGVENKDIPYFSTLHSLAFRSMGVTSDQVLTDEIFAKFAQVEGYHFSVSGDPWKSRDDRALAASNLARSTGRSLEDCAFEMQVELDWARHVDFDVATFKEQRALVDFTDMIVRFVEDPPKVGIDFLIVDEAQDLSALQWKMVDILRENAKEVIVAGDDDQAIYRWAGADLERFLGLSAERKVLERSFRLPRAVHGLCNRIIGAVEKRYPKDWGPRNEDGEVIFVDRIETLDMNTEKSWFFLARSLYQLAMPRSYLWASGVPYVYRTQDGHFRSSSDRPDVKAYLTLLALQKGQEVDHESATNFWRFLKPKHTAPEFRKAKFAEPLDLATMRRVFGLTEEALDLSSLEIRPNVKSHICAAEERGEDLRSPRVTCSTIHGVKGGEADAVYLIPDVSRTVFESSDPNDESRVFFVAASRARKRLFIQTPKTSRYHDLGGLLN